MAAAQQCSCCGQPITDPGYWAADPYYTGQKQKHRRWCTPCKVRGCDNWWRSRNRPHPTCPGRKTQKRVIRRSKTGPDES